MWSSSSSGGEPDNQTKHESFNDRHERREAIRDYWNLQDTPRRMLQAAERDGYSKEQLRNATLEAAKHAAGIGRYSSNQFSPLSYNEIRRDDVAIASRVMAMPELTEAILSYTSIPDILDVSQVSRSLKAIIEASPKLQRQLFLKPAESTSVVHTLTEMPFEDMTVERLGDGPDGETRLKVEVGIRKCKRVNIGSTRRRMLICQPPLKRIFVTSAFDECHVIFRNGHEELHSAAGLTVGDLYDKALELVRVDSPCRDCEKEHAAAQDGRRIRVDHECLVEFESSIKNSKSECYFEDQRRTRSRIHRPNQTFGERCTVGMDIERRESGGRRLWAWVRHPLHRQVSLKPARNKMLL